MASSHFLTGRALSLSEAYERMHETHEIKCGKPALGLGGLWWLVFGALAALVAVALWH